MSKGVDKFLSTYSGTNLLKKHNFDEEGIWEVRGEDPNCDLGGSHYQPRLGIYSGNLKDILELAVEMNSFWQWGAGGSISKIKIHTIEDVTEKRELYKERAKIEARLAEIDKKLK